MPSEIPDYRPDYDAARPTRFTSRRTVLFGAAAGAGLVIVPTSASAALPMVRPLSAAAVVASFGVNAKPNFLRSGYRYYREWMAGIASMGATSFRGFYAPGLPQTLAVVKEARRLGLKWDMVIAQDRSTSNGAIDHSLRHIAANAADRCLSVKGLNEPNHVRGSGPVRADWWTDTIRVQRAIWNGVKADPRLRHVTVVGPTLQDVYAQQSDYQRLADRGILRLMDVGAIHRYPGGHYPDHLMDDRLALLRRTWPGKPIWIAETGYTNAVASRGGNRPVPEWVAADYAPSALLEAVDRGCRTAFFEALDDPDPGAKDVTEANFGLFATRTGDGPPWRAKPIVDSMRAMLTQLRDPGPAYTPAPVAFRATGPGDLRTTLTAKRDGSVTAHLRRATDCWDVTRTAPIKVTAARVKVESAKGVRYVNVDHRVTSLRL